MTKFKHCILCIILLCISFVTYAESQDKNSFVIQNVRIFDGQRILSDNLIVVQDGKIAGIGNKSNIPAGAVIIDGMGYTLLPGLIDSHVHIYHEDALRQSLIFGVTTVMDMLTDINFLSEIKRQQVSGNRPDCAEFFSAGICVTAPGGHPTQLGIKIPTIKGHEEAQAFVDARIAEGSDYIKIMYDDGKELNINMPTLSKETLAAVIKAAHKRNKMAVVHIETSQFARDVIAAGADGLAHTFIDVLPDDDFYKLAADKKIFVIPTLAVQQPFCGDPGGTSLTTDQNLLPYLTGMDITNLKKYFPSSPASKISYSVAEKSISFYKKYGIPILAGTDVANWGTAYGASLHRELELLVQAGLSPTEALRSATSVPAKTFALKDRGNIAIGLRADLLLVKGDPTKDIKATRNIIGIWRSGVRTDRDAYRAAIEAKKVEAARQAQAPPPPGSESGLVSDFEGHTLSAKFGLGWQLDSDKVIGGKSTSEYKLVPDGANKSRGSMLITGEIVPGSQYTWAGMIFFPGKKEMSPANLSCKKEICFWAKGDGRTYALYIYSKRNGYRDGMQIYTPGSEWTFYSYPISVFNGIDGSDITGISFSAFDKPGKFKFQIDEVAFK